MKLSFTGGYAKVIILIIIAFIFFAGFFTGITIDKRDTQFVGKYFDKSTGKYRVSFIADSNDDFYFYALNEKEADDFIRLMGWE